MEDTAKPEDTVKPEDRVKPEVVAAAAAAGNDENSTPDVSQPTKLIRIASMTRAMLDEARQASLDDGGRKRMAKVHQQSVAELQDILSAELQEEFGEIMIPLSNEDASESELRVAQAQLIGWLEGLFHGIQASLWSQQVAAQSQLAEMQKRALTAPRKKEQDDGSSGLYL